MTERPTSFFRPFALFVLLAMAFTGGMLVDRVGRWLFPMQYPPAGADGALAPFWETWHLAERYYVDRDAVDPHKLSRAAIRGLVFSLGDIGHTRYLTPEELKDLRNDLEGRLEGIGARMSLRKREPTIVQVIRKSPAEEAGLKAGDIVLEVNHKNVVGLPLDQVVRQVRGPADTEVHVKIRQAGSPGPRDMTLSRRRVEVPDVVWAMVPGTSLAHVAIQNFGHETQKQLRAAIQEAQQQHVRGLIVDVRGNAGGLKQQAVLAASEFIKNGDVFIEQDAHGKREPVPVVGGGTALDLPLCLLIDEASASSAEILAGAIQDHARGKLIGGRTVGTGTVLQAFSLSDGSAVLLAIRQWLTPTGRQIRNKGISPDVAIALPDGAILLLPDNVAQLSPEALSRSEDKQLLKAIELLRQEIH